MNFKLAKFCFLIFILITIACETRKENNQKKEIRINSFKDEQDSQSFQASSFPSSFQTSTWKKVITEDCINYLYFSIDKTYKNYSCEKEDTLYGHYEIIKDTLLLHREKSFRDSIYQVSPQSPHHIAKAKYKLVLSNDKLYYIEGLTYNESYQKWERINYDFKNSKPFIKIDK